MFLVIETGNFIAVGVEMMRQHIVDIPRQRHLAFPDNPADGLDRVVELLADIGRLTDTSNGTRLPDKECFVVLLPVAPAAGIFPNDLRSGKRIIGFVPPNRSEERRVGKECRL